MDGNGQIANGVVKPTAYSMFKADAEFVKKAWPDFIRPGLLAIKAKDKRSGHWLPEHVRAYIEAGFAGRLLCECHVICPVDKATPTGFIVMRAYNDEFAQIPLSLFLWIVYNKVPGMGLLPSINAVLPHIQPAVERRAKELGLLDVTGISSRLGWGEALAPYGYEVHQVIYRKRLYKDEV
jgi:hypothetical protein